MEVVLSRNARELFEQPARTPLDDDYEPWCIDRGVEHLAQVVRADPRARIVLDLPSAGPGAEQVRAAQVRYCEARAEELTLEIRAEIRHGLWALVPTGTVFALTLALSRLADNTGSHWISRTIAEALVVIGWVVLWAPVAIFGTDIWVLGASRRAYWQLARHELEIR